MDYAKKHEKQQLDQFELNIATKDLASANQQRKELSDESRNIFDDFYDKILFYSAGAFSFSVALIGLVLKDKAVALAHVAFIIPNIFWLYISMFLYLMVCGLVLLAKKFDALYAGSIGAYFYLKKLERYEKANIDFHKSHQGQVRVKNSSTEQEITTAASNLEKAESAKVKTDKQTKLYYRLKRICHWGAELLVFIATSLLFLFFIQLMQTTIWTQL